MPFRPAFSGAEGDPNNPPNAIDLSAVQGVTTVDIEGVLGTSRQTMRRLAQDTFTLANDRVRVIFDGGTGAVLSIEDLQAGRPCRVAEPGTPIFSLDTLDFKHAWFHQPSDTVTRTARSENLSRCPSWMGERF